MVLLKQTQIIVKITFYLENFVKILKDSDKNIKPLLDWKHKKEWYKYIKFIFNIKFFKLKIINLIKIYLIYTIKNNLNKNIYKISF